MQHDPDANVSSIMKGRKGSPLRRWRCARYGCAPIFGWAPGYLL